MVAKHGQKKQDDEDKNKDSQGRAQIIITVIGAIAAVVVAIIGILPNLIQRENETPVPESVPAGIASVPTNATSRRVLLDTYHGYPLVDIGSYSTWNLEFKFEELQTPLTAEILKEFDVYLLYLPRYTNKQHSLTFDELAIIRDYIDFGGKVFLIGVGWVWAGDYPNEEYPLNVIANKYGIELTSDFINTVNSVHYNDAPIVFDSSTMKEHPVTDGIKKIGAAKSAPGTLIVSLPAVPLIWGKNTNAKSSEPIILAAAELPNKGKLVVLQHPNYIKPFDINQYENQKFPDVYDNLKLFENILDWLANG